jgi:hypothetical protein
VTPERYDKLKFDLWMALNAVRHADWFTAQLFRLFSKADTANRHRLSQGYPDEAMVFQDWRSSPDENDFYGADLIARGKKAREEADK